MLKRLGIIEKVRRMYRIFHSHYSLIKRYIIFMRIKYSFAKNFYITCRRGDGIGAQVIAYYSTIIFAKKMGIKYLHSPFYNLEHTPELLKQLEEFFSIGNGEQYIHEIKNPNIRLEHVPKAHQLKKNNNLIVVLTHCHSYTNIFPKQYIYFKKEFLRRYNSQSKNKWVFEKKENHIYIAVHLRRGDVQATGKNANRFTSNTSVLSVLKEIIIVIKEKKYKPIVHIYSQGDKDEFKDFLSLNSQFFLDECLELTIHHLITADILIMSKSALSYMCGILSNNVIIYEDFWHPPLKGWVRIKEGKLDVKMLRKQLKHQKKLISVRQLPT